MKTARLTREQKIDQSVVDILNKMFEIAGHPVTYEDIKDRKDAWYRDWTMTVEQAEEWQSWGTEYLRKHLKLRKATAERQMMWTNVQWGLRYSNYGESQDHGQTKLI